MFGGLTKTSSRIAIIAALGLTLGGFAFKANPAKAADLGGDCCADLEERVAELEATTVRKGNKKVSVTLSGWVVKSMNWWDDGDINHFVVGDKDYDLGTRFAITGSATIAPGWSAGFNITVNSWGTVFGNAANQYDDLAAPTGANGNVYGNIATLYSYIYIKSDKWGSLNWGHLSPASDNPAVLADISGTVIESNAVLFEGAGFFLRPKGTGANGLAGLSGLTWGSFATCTGLGAALGADCFGVAEPAVRYDSPTWGGFRFETSYGKVQATENGTFTGFFTNDQTNRDFEVDSSDTDFWDAAVFYTADWNSIKLSVAGAYTWIETGATTLGTNSVGSDNPNCQTCDPYFDATDDRGGSDVNLWQIGGSIMHKPSGLGIYGLYQHEDTGGSLTDVSDCFEFGCPDARSFSIPDTDVWYVKPFWRKTWTAAGATTLYGEYGEYNDMYSSLVGVDFESGGTCSISTSSANVFDCYITGSQIQRWGLGVVQEIDSAAMHVWARWQHQELDFDVVGFGGAANGFDPNAHSRLGSSDSDDWDLFQAGGIIFF